MLLQLNFVNVNIAKKWDILWNFGEKSDVTNEYLATKSLVSLIPSSGAFQCYFIGDKINSLKYVSFQSDSLKFLESYAIGKNKLTSSNKSW